MREITPCYIAVLHFGVWLLFYFPERSRSRPVKMVMTIRSLIKNFMRLMAVSWTIQSCLCWKHELKFWLDLDFR